jgi:hypothetical protein
MLRISPGRYFLLMLVGLMLSLFAFAACGDDADTSVDGDGTSDGDVSDGETDGDWNPDGDEPDGDACDSGYGGYGYGDCGDSGLDCSQEPCVFGECLGSADTSHCVCWEGYAGELCDICAEGYVIRGLRCMPANACDGVDCVFGTCEVINTTPVCNCEEGYAGERCDRCADGFIVQDLRCVPATR